MSVKLPKAPTAKQLIKFRHKHGLRQKDFGELLGDSQRSVQMWETGGRELNPIKWAYIRHVLGEKELPFNSVKAH